MKPLIISLLNTILPNKIKRALFHLGFNLDKQEFERFAYMYAKAPNMKLGLIQARNLGLDCRSILDIGAYHGDWSRMAREIWTNSQLTMIEANTQKQKILKHVADEIGADLWIELLGAKDDLEVEFYVMESGSSVFEEHSPLDRKRETRTTRTLDALFPDGTFDFIKIDVQGYELEVLDGANNLMQNCTAVLMEISTIEVNKNCPLLNEVLIYMDKKGFVAYDLMEIHRRPLDNALNQIDFMFVRKDSALIENKSHF